MWIVFYYSQHILDVLLESKIYANNLVIGDFYGYTETHPRNYMMSSKCCRKICSEYKKVLRSVAVDASQRIPVEQKENVGKNNLISVEQKSEKLYTVKKQKENKLSTNQKLISAHERGKMIPRKRIKKQDGIFENRSELVTQFPRRMNKGIQRGRLKKNVESAEDEELQMNEEKGDANDTITSDNVSGYANRLKKHLDLPKYKLNVISIPKKKQVFDFKPRTEPDIMSSSVANISKKNTGLLILTVIIELFFLLFGIFVLVFDKAESVNIDGYDDENLHELPNGNVHNSLVYFGSYSYQC